MKILIGCPTYYKYDKYLDLYLDAIKNQTFKDFDLVLVDNSPDDKYLEKIKSKGVLAIKGPHSEDAYERIALSRELLRKKCINEEYDAFLSLEQDILITPDALEKLISHKKDLVSVYFGYEI